MEKSLRVLVVDDQPRARASLKALLATCPTIGQVQEAANGREALESVAKSPPDVVLMDVLMPEMNGLEATRAIKATGSPAKVIVLSMYGEYAREASAAGADSFITKGESPDLLLKTLLHLSSAE